MECLTVFVALEEVCSYVLHDTSAVNTRTLEIYMVANIMNFYT